MKPFRCEHGTLVPLDRSDVDTDQIIPKQFLKRIERTGYGAFLFHEWRYEESGAERPSFVLNATPYRTGTVLLAGPNFGCGSSREHAVWALQDHGFRAVIAPSFADIFHGNALSCGLLPVTLPEHEVRALLDLATEEPGVECIVDLEDGTVSAGDLRFTFRLEPTQRRLLLDGLDDITLTLHNLEEISAYEATRASWMPDVSRVEQPA
ncbi:MAG: 3-isopropylmalate dehydratase small subunit [Candidatus Dormibacter sp.]